MTFFNYTLNTPLNMNYELKSYFSLHEWSCDDKVDSWIHSSHSNSHLLDCWNKLLDVIEDSSKRIKGTFSKYLKELSRLHY